MRRASAEQSASGEPELSIAWPFESGVEYLLKVGAATLKRIRIFVAAGQRLGSELINVCTGRYTIHYRNGRPTVTPVSLVVADHVSDFFLHKRRAFAPQ